VNARIGVTTLCLVLAFSSAAFAGGPDRKECLAAADDGQKLRDEGKLGAARDRFITCSAKACPGVVAKQCSQWLEAVERDLPSVSFRVLDEQKRELVDVSVLFDGVKLSDTVEAKARALDPGSHTVRVERADGRSVEQKVLLRPGEKNRIVELAFEAPPAAPAPPATPAARPDVDANKGGGFHVPLLGWIGLGVGVAGGVATALFAMSANGDEKDLRDTCAPTCPSSERSPIETKVLLANVGFGVGVVGLGVGIVATVMANTGKPVKKEASRASSLSLDVSPSGAVLLRGAF
jgi:hypothetical protein